MFGRKKKKKQKKVYTGSYVVKDVDNIISIAQSHGVSWKKLAKINGIEPPYILISGETISVPGEDDDKDVDAQDVVQISDVKNSEHNKKQSGINTQMKQSVGAVNGGVKTSTQTTQKSTSPQVNEKVPQQEKPVSSNNKKPRKVTYASPKNMLHKPSAEPTTQAINIEWMQDDETTYSEETKLQRKRLNVRFIIISILIIVVVGFIAWWSVIWFLKHSDNEDVSVQTLIKEESSEGVDKGTENTIENVEESGSGDETDNGDSGDNTVTNDDKHVGDTESDENVEKQDAEETDKNNQQDEEVVSVGEITVQVLNAGAQVGAAGDVTSEFVAKGYKTGTAKNANNDYNDVVIYYSSDKKSALESVAKEVSEKYGTQKYEESDDVTKKYKADFVIVLGS